MFTGIIEELGRVRSVERRGDGARLLIEARTVMEGTQEGDSIAVNGVCLTAVSIEPDGFSADISAETLARTTFGRMHPGRRVNLEKALALGDRLGGHLVSGHVDGIGTVSARRTAARSIEFRIAAPPALAKYIAHKGALCLDGVSLTVNRVEAAEFEVNIVPHTLQATTLNALVPGSDVNIEVDILARYLERLLSGDELAGRHGDPTAELLARIGLGK